MDWPDQIWTWHGKDQDPHAVYLSVDMTPGRATRVIRVRLDPAAVADPSQDPGMYEIEARMYRGPVLWKVNRGHEHKLLYAMVPQASPAFVVAAMCVSWMERPRADFSPSQEAALATIQHLLRCDPDLHLPSWPQPLRLAHYIAGLDGLFFGGKLAAHVTVFLVPSDDPMLLGRIGYTRIIPGVPGRPARAMIYVDDHRDHPHADNASWRRWRVLCVLLHEFAHALLGVYSCQCYDCVWAIGRDGHGEPWGRVTRAINAMINAHILSSPGAVPFDHIAAAHAHTVARRRRRRHLLTRRASI